MINAPRENTEPFKGDGTAELAAFRALIPLLALCVFSLFLFDVLDVAAWDGTSPDVEQALNSIARIWIISAPVVALAAIWSYLAPPIWNEEIPSSPQRLQRTRDKFPNKEINRLLVIPMWA